MKYSGLNINEAHELFESAARFYVRSITTAQQRRDLARAGLEVHLKVWVTEKGRCVAYTIKRGKERLFCTRVPKRLVDFIDAITALEA